MKFFKKVGSIIFKNDLTYRSVLTVLLICLNREQIVPHYQKTAHFIVGVKPYACQRCGKRFALKSYLSKHEESTCIRSNNKPRKNS